MSWTSNGTRGLHPPGRDPERWKCERWRCLRTLSRVPPAVLRARTRRGRTIRLLLGLVLLVPRCAPAPSNDHPAGEALEYRVMGRDGAVVGARKIAIDDVRRWHDAHDAGSSTYRWEPIGPSVIHAYQFDANGRVTAIILSPQADRVVVGTSGGGIWRSDDRGRTFVPVTDDQADITVGAMAVAPSNSQVVYAAMGDDRNGTGVLQSRDGGGTWRRVSTAFASHSAATRILIDPHDDAVVWLVQSRAYTEDGTSSVRGALLKSTDGGATWKTTFNGVVTDVLLGSSDGETIIVGASRGSTVGTGGLYRSVDGGTTWQLVLAQGQPEVPPRYVLASFGNALFAVAVDSINDGARRRVLRSIDGGLTWVVQGDAPSESRFYYLAVNPRDGALFLGGTYLYRSDDQGATWKRSSGLHVDQRAIAFDAGRVWLGTDGGLSTTTDNGATFTSFADRLPVAQLYTVAASSTNPNLIGAGTQDNGIVLRVDGSEWKELRSGDGVALVFDPNGTRALLWALGEAPRRISLDSGNIEEIWNPAAFDDEARPNFLAPLVRASDGIVWMGTSRVFASPDFGTSWTAPGGAVTLTNNDDDVLIGIDVAMSDPRTLYTISLQGRVMSSTDRGVSWNEILQTSAPPTAVCSDARDAHIVYLALAGYGATRIMKSTDGGSSWRDASDGLPRVPVNALYSDRQRPGVLYAGTDVGVFRSTDGATWLPFDIGMPHAVVTAFATTADHRLLAATYGRGIYQLVERSTGTDSRRRAVRH